jgi:ribosomal protein L11 methyltransferase
MNRLRNQTPNPDTATAAPCQELFIYYLKGRMKPDGAMFADNYLGNWEEEDDSFLFFSQPALEQVETLLNRQPQLSYVDSYHMPYTEWLGETFRTFEQGQFRILPPWEAPPDNTSTDGAAHAILLHPGLVFGTGTHPTTRDCLDALELAAGTHKLNNVLDLGTGTGLLALAAAKLGSSSIVAVDLNLLAARTAAHNVRLNGLQNRILAVQGRAEDMIACSADLLIANIHYHVMRRLVEDKGFLAKKRFILSGLLRSEAKTIAGILARQPVTITQQWTHEGIWHTIYGKTNS